MIIAITGTPGTGKTAVGRALRRLGETVIGLGELARKNGLLGRYDRKRDTREVNLKNLSKALPSHRGGRVFLEGHLAHLLRVDFAVVLRCPPAVLRRRLARRGYGVEKIRENSLAEALDAITVEAAKKLGARRVFELSTCGKSPGPVARTILKLARARFSGAGAFRPGAIDYSGDILRKPDYYTPV